MLVRVLEAENEAKIEASRLNKERAEKYDDAILQLVSVSVPSCVLIPLETRLYSGQLVCS